MPVDALARKWASRGGKNAWAASVGVFTTARPKVAFLGHSMAANNHNTTGQDRTINSYGLAYHILRRTRGRVSCPERLNFGVGGSTTTEQITRTFADFAASPPGGTGYVPPKAVASYPNMTPLQAAVASDADIVVIFATTNDRGAANMTAAQTLANIETMVAGLSGKQVIVYVDPPRGDTTYTATRLAGTQLAYHLDAAQRLRELPRRTRRVYAVDPWGALAVQGSSTGDIRTGATYDGLHLIFPAARIGGEAIGDVINSLVPAFNGLLPTSAADIWSASNPSGSLNNSPTLSPINAAAGGFENVTVSGNLPTGWQHDASRCDGLTIAYTTTTKNGLLVPVMTVTGTPTKATVNHRVQALWSAGALAGLASGDVIYSVGDGEFTAGASGLFGFQLRQEVYRNSNNTQIETVSSGSLVDPIASALTTELQGAASLAWSGPFITDEYLHTGEAAHSTSTRTEYRFNFKQNVAVNIVFTFGPTATRKVL